MYLNNKALLIIEEALTDKGILDQTKDFVTGFAQNAWKNIVGASAFASNYLSDRFTGNTKNIKDEDVKARTEKIKKEIANFEKKIKKLELDLRSADAAKNPEKKEKIEKQLNDAKSKLAKLKNSEGQLINYYYGNEFKNKLQKGLGLMAEPFKQNPLGAGVTLGGAGLLGLGLSSFGDDEIDPELFQYLSQ